MKSSMLSSQERKLQAKYARKYALEVDSQIDSELEQNRSDFIKNEHDQTVIYNNYDQYVHDNLIPANMFMSIFFVLNYSCQHVQFNCVHLL